MNKVHNGRFPSSTHWSGIQIFFSLVIFFGGVGRKQCLAHTVLISDWSPNGMFGSH